MKEGAIKTFEAAVSEAAAPFRTGDSAVLLLHHNDADGLTSGAIVESALQRENRRVFRYCLEKPYPKALETIWHGHAGAGVRAIIADFGSGMLPILSAVNAGRIPVTVLDHHAVSPTDDSSIRLVNPLSVGLSGRTESSASTVCFLFARALNGWNEDLAAIAVLGALGDGQRDAGGGWSGLNAVPAGCAERLGLMRAGSGELKGEDSWHQSSEIVDALNALGSIGYLRGGPDVGIKALRDGFGRSALDSAAVFRREYEQLSAEFLRAGQWIDSDPLVSFHLDARFERCGVKTVGLMAELLRDGPLAANERYIVGFQPVPPQIPGLGSIEIPEIKVSMRITAPMWKKVESGERPTLVDILPKAALGLGGFVDACHPHAAAVTVPIGAEQALLDALRPGIN